MKETGRNGFQSRVIKRINKEFPKCEVHKLDPTDTQGIPDLLILCPNKWGTLETKKSEKAHKQPNQEYYVNKHNNMAFSKFIFPSNEEEVFAEFHAYMDSEEKENKE